MSYFLEIRKLRWSGRFHVDSIHDTLEAAVLAMRQHMTEHPECAARVRDAFTGELLAPERAKHDESFDTGSPVRLLWLREPDGRLSLLAEVDYCCGGWHIVDQINGIAADQQDAAWHEHAADLMDEALHAASLPCRFSGEE